MIIIFRKEVYLEAFNFGILRDIIAVPYKLDDVWYIPITIYYDPGVNGDDYVGLLEITISVDNKRIEQIVTKDLAKDGGTDDERMLANITVSYPAVSVFICFHLKN